MKNTSIILLGIISLFLTLSCKKDKPVTFSGKVIIIGAGASGLAAAKKLDEKGISYQILEATGHYGGRTQKNETFADFPIDLGSEWLHADKSILNKLLDKEGSEPDVEMVLYQPRDFYRYNGTEYKKVSKFELDLMYTFGITEYKFKSTTWYDYIDNNFAQMVKHNIVYNAKVNDIDYSGEQVKVSTENGEEYFADKVILTVSVGVLKSKSIQFTPALSTEKVEAIDDVEFLPGLKLFMKFSNKFYPDAIDCETPNGEKGFFDAAYHKEAEDNVLTLLSQGLSAEEYYALGSTQAIVDNAIAELDDIFDGAASQYYTGDYILKDWGRQENTLGSWTIIGASSSKHLKSCLDYKVYFAGETYKLNHPLYLRGSAHGAILSGYNAAETILYE